MSAEWQAYVKDPRIVCKFGAKCYQKNPEHHSKCKHPPTGISKHDAGKHKRRNKRISPYTRKTNKDESGEVAEKEFETAKIDTEIQESECAENNDGAAAELSASKPDNLQNESDENLVNIRDQIPENVTYHDATADQAKYKELFLVEMPPDFFQFYECLKDDGQDVEKMLSSVNLELIGPYDLLVGKMPMLDNNDLYLIHWRFFYDPPEFQAVLKSKDRSEFHIGYFRDEPKAPPVFLARNDSSKDCHLTPYATNIFAAVYLYLENQKKTPFNAMNYKKMMEKVKSWAEKHDYSVEEYNAKRRVNLSNAKTLHGAGIMVPYDKKTQLGYRRLVESDANIRKLFTKLQEAKSEKQKDSVLSELQPVITYANIAVDECDFGTGLEVGIDLFCSGLKELESSALNSLCSAYSLLNRAEFGNIIQAHLKYRRKGSEMSVLSIGNKL